MYDYTLAGFFIGLLMWSTFSLFFLRRTYPKKPWKRDLLMALIHGLIIMIFLPIAIWIFEYFS
ncbi:hypothetical protein E3U55_07950 [Filobacillus milosensis]|uniref:Uncharacterized protein n=1 Tax=Filobacillus milosensis TaxID=94137 RepID=A0A4Y8INL7_9BACI|nr:hypothetical protein [Filobacillus milosensis]TFB21753.1 hypothetical protein E3U55_07950 [Filobacillus milosensis]